MSDNVYWTIQTILMGATALIVFWLIINAIAPTERSERIDEDFYRDFRKRVRKIEDEAECGRILDRIEREIVDVELRILQKKQRRNGYERG
ncbi:hypothetical protein J1TS1_28300 [Shouchella clausii]|uniref:hypothetical protein n=1 Tax=Shouchella clausii TaxID=79880 RepID=UPI001B0E09E3|nr:hypothetical protein [Shouchella clausii]GIN08685.1 hypothetical protein J1TS1_28300 [Shouchella clausii]